MDTSTMDPDTAKLAIEMQLADITELLCDLYDEASTGDQRSTLEVLQRDLQRQLEILDGQVLTLSILREENQGRVTFAKLVKEERQAVGDHELAMGLAESDDNLAGIVNRTDYEIDLAGSEECGEDEQWKMAKQLYSAAFSSTELSTCEGGPPSADTNDQANGREEAKQNPILGSDALTKCISCMEIIAAKDTLTLSCEPESHTYCRICLTGLFKSAIYDTAMFPPRCCKVPIPLELCQYLLPNQLVKDFDLKVEELATPNPTHCANSECNKFIRPTQINGEIGSCVFCGYKTCVQCKCKSHIGLCESDPHVQLLMDVAARSRWQRCTRCKDMVELATGCFHMTCRCLHQFCYLCGAQWKHCNCPKWHEEYLTGPVVVGPAVRPAGVIPNPIPAAHEHDWRREEGGECDECLAETVPWVMRCARCHVRNCWHCCRAQ